MRKRRKKEKSIDTKSKPREAGGQAGTLTDRKIQRQTSDKVGRDRGTYWRKEKPATICRESREGTHDKWLLQHEVANEQKEHLKDNGKGDIRQNRRKINKPD